VGVNVPDRFDELQAAALDGPGELDPALRHSAAEAGSLPDPLAAFALRVRERPFTFSDRPFEELRGAGWSEDAIFELTVAAAVGAGLRRLDAGLAAIEAAGA
jgi:alkylhydroperoxidase family enzyme